MAAEEEDRRRKKSRKGGICQCLPKLGLSLVLIPFGLSGFILGLWLKSQNLSDQCIHLIGFPGQLVLRAYFLITIPLLFSSIVAGISSIRKERISRMISLTVLLFLGLSTLSAIMGAVAGHVAHPGWRIANSNDTEPSKIGNPSIVLDATMDLLWNSVPNNVLEATFTKERRIVPEANNASDSGQKVPIFEKGPGTNYMGLIVFSVLFGCGLAAMGERGEQMSQVIEQGTTAVLRISKYFIKILPIGMFFWMLRQALVSTTPDRILGTMGLFLATVFACIAFHQLLLLPFLYLIIVRKNPVIFHMNLMPAILTAFGTSSSVATLPVTLRCAENANCLNPSVTRFVLPFGMVAHMNGGTFYAVLSVIFLAQLEGISLGIMQTTYLCLTSILLYISTSGTPSLGSPTNLLLALASVGITQSKFIYLYVATDWLMERFRTMMNIVSDCYVAAYVEKLCGSSLPEESIEFETPLIDGYDHRAHSAPTNICKACGHRID